MPEDDIVPELREEMAEYDRERAEARRERRRKRVRALVVKLLGRGKRA